MKTLRAKLFVNVGAILLLAGILNTFSSNFWIKKDLDKAGIHINERLEEIQSQIQKFISFLLTFHIVEEATELEKVIQIAGKSSSIWQKVGSVLEYNPDIAFIQVQDQKKKSIAIVPSDVPLRSFKWALNDESIWVYIDGENELFKGVFHEGFYLLFKAPNPPPFIPHSKFIKIPLPSFSYTWKDDPSHLFLCLLGRKNQWLEKVELIQKLLPWQEKPDTDMPLGIIKLDKEKKQGSCLLTKGLFLKKSLIEYTKEQETNDIPSLILRNTFQGEELDMVKSISFLNAEKEIMTIGFSLSSILKEIALLIQKTIIATSSDFIVGFAPSGEPLDLKKNQISLIDNSQVTLWENNSYVKTSIDLGVLKLFLLTPLDQAKSTSRFLQSLNISIVDTISLSLIGAAIFSFLIALLLLNNISKKITDPISTLSKAAQTLGEGHYENLILPKIHHRQDEVAALAHSFEGMVGALKNRDKIQGLLNKVVSKEISQKILEQNIELSGEEKIVTLLFSDIRNFTHLAEDLPPHLLIEILNAYMTRMCRIIDETHGVVDKFIGDAIMTLYGAPISLDFHAVKAIDAALLMKKNLLDWNVEREKNGTPIFEIGIGIHTGLVYTGNMGAENRLNYTAIGANVNQASRLCSIAKPMQILISDDTLKSPGVEEKFQVQKLEPAFLKGIEHPVQIYEVIGLK